MLRLKLTEERIFSGDFRMVACRGRVVKMKERLSCRKCSTLYIEDKVVVDHAV